MRELRFHTRDEDGGIVVASDDGLDRFRLVVDEGLRAVLNGRPPRPAAAPATGSATPSEEVSPREIQTRVRAGEQPEAIAREHDVPLERVMRFATAVLAERARITDEARRARARRVRRDDTDGELVLFGETVDERFTAYGVEHDGVAWDSHRRDDGAWVIVAAWQRGPAEHEARWLFQRTGRTVAPLDEAATDLLSDRPIRPLSASAPEAVVTQAPPLAPGVIAFPPFPDAHTGPIPRLEQVYDQYADDRDPLDRPRPDAPAPESAGPRPIPTPHHEDEPPVTARRPGLAALVAAAPLTFDEPQLPLAISDAEGRPIAARADTGPLHAPAGATGGPSEEDKATRARIPSWDDILLGVRRKQD